MKSLTEFVNILENSNELLRVQDFVNPEFEIAEIADRMMKQPNGGKAILFENTGTNFPVIINHFGSNSRILKALGISDFNDEGHRIEFLFKSILKPQSGIKSKLSLLLNLNSARKWFPNKKSGKGKCQEVTIMDPDLSILPVLKCWPYDGGRFFTLPLVITEDPENGIRNIGMYRMQVFNKNTTGMHWHLHKGGAAHFNKYKNTGKKMPVSVVLGGDPLLTYCATAPLPENIDEFILAGFLKGEKINLVKCITNNIYVPESSDFVIEGYIDPAEDFAKEGPFGDHTGFYSLADYYPVFHITCITHRKDAIFPATIVGIPPMEDFYLGKATEKIFLKPIQIAIAPEVLDIRLPSYGVAHNLVLVKTKTNYPGQNFKIMNALLGAGQMMFSKVIVCFNETVDLNNDLEILSTISNLEQLTKNIIIGKGPSDVLDHASYEYTFSGKMLVDAGNITQPHNETITNYNLNDGESIFLNNRIALVKKTIQNKKPFLKIIEEYSNTKNYPELKFVIYIDDLDFSAVPNLLPWYILNNIDPSHDCVIKNDILFVNASIKTLSNDNFNREWPNIVCMDEKTIEIINKKWSVLTGLENIESPSTKVKHLFKGNSAIYNK
ncbi:MAG TPA: menaquinone biosynthesis decarboxylase [Bacteroidales bacterium]|nr:menaquinone biosynthesis decarboxylase [Bacteroidales bacterium]